MSHTPSEEDAKYLRERFPELQEELTSFKAFVKKSPLVLEHANQSLIELTAALVRSFVLSVVCAPH